MIQELLIKNFQSHKDSTLEFDKGVNIIVGSSDSGKSAIIRALRWLKDNRPSGDSFRSNWGGKTQVELFTNNSHIVRSKDKEEEYILGDTHFKAFRTDVPKEIQDALNLSDINLQTQLEAPFLLSETPGAVAQHFNKVARLDKIDQSTQNINSGIRQHTADIKYKEGQIETKQEALKKFEYLEKFEIKLEVLEGLEKQLIIKSNSYKKLDGFLNDLNDVNEEIKEASQILIYEKEVDNLLDLIDKRNKVRKSRKLLENLWHEINDDSLEIDEQNKLITLEPSIISILKLYEERRIKETNKIKLFKAISLINNTQIQLEEEEDELKALEVEFKDSFPEICPLCNKPK
jgi:DNA repair exonuclease SbcCD ATPase subunit